MTERGDGGLGKASADRRPGEGESGAAGLVGLSGVERGDGQALPCRAHSAIDGVLRDGGERYGASGRGPGLFGDLFILQPRRVDAFLERPGDVGPGPAHGAAARLALGGLAEGEGDIAPGCGEAALTRCLYRRPGVEGLADCPPGHEQANAGSGGESGGEAAPGDGGADAASDVGVDRTVDRGADVRPGGDDAACGLVRCFDQSFRRGVKAVGCGAFGAPPEV